ncbi:MAG: hypothetical protein HXX13_16115 [Bacteroidetes bacterium]|nr:hypothetical protein [Bacteroidota bacterium]
MKQNTPSKLKCRRASKNLVRALLFLLMIILSSQAFTQSQTFTSTGSGQSFTVPAGVTSITVHAWGGGGGGSSITSLSRNGGGGGGGAYASSTVSVIPGINYSVIVGAGGAANTSGENSSFNINTVRAAGGAGALYNSNTRGEGGSISNCIGNMSYKGGDGAYGTSYQSSGGGGGGAGTNGAGGNALIQTGGLGTPQFGGSGGSGYQGTGPGGNGNDYGGGGGGSSTMLGIPFLPWGGSGANGLVIISWNCPNYNIMSTSANSSVCAGSDSQINLSGTADGLPVGIYTVTYNLSTPNAAIGQTASMTVTNAGIGSFNTVYLTNPGITTITITNLASGTGTGTGAQNCNSLITTNNSTDITVVSPLPQPSNIVGMSSPCYGSAQSYNVTNILGTTYSWEFPTEWTITSGQGTSSVNVTVGSEGGTVSVTPSNLCGTAPLRSRLLTVNNIPNSLTASVSPNPICEGDTLYLTGSASGASSWSWVGPAGFTSTAENSSIPNITMAGAGIYYLAASNSCGEASQVTTSSVNIYPLTSPTLSGPSPACLNSTGNVYTTQASMSGYTWSAEGGSITSGGSGSDATAIISWTLSGNQSVRVNFTNPDGCPGAAPFVLYVPVNPLPTPTISGPSTGCLNSTGNVYTTQVGMTSYVWNVVGGTITAGGTGYSNTATITWTSSGVQSVSVNYSDANGCSAQQPVIYYVDVKSIPVLPSVISPASNKFICAQVLGVVYSVNNIEGVTYNWNYSGTGGVIYGNGSSNITMDFLANATNGTLSVTASNSCGSSTARNLSIVVSTLKVAYAGPDQTVCSGSPNVIMSGSYSPYSGSPIALWTSVGTGTFDNANILNAEYVPSEEDILNGTVTLSLNIFSGSCISADDIDITFSPQATPFAGLPQTACEGETIHLNGTIGGFYTTTYWSAPTGSFSDPGSLSTEYTPDINSGTVTLTLSANDPDGIGPCGVASSMMDLTVKALPVTPESASSNRNSICADDNGSIELTANGGSGNNMLWFSGSCEGISIGSGNHLTIPSPEITTTYFARWEDDCGFSDCIPLTVTVLPNITPSASSNSPICLHNTLQLIGTPADMTSYIWSGPNGFTSDAQNPSINDVLIQDSGTYYLEVTDDVGCSSMTSTFVIVSDLPTVSFAPLEPVCALNNAVLLVGSPHGGTFTGPGVTGDHFDPLISGPGVFTLSYEYNNGICSNSAISSIAVNPCKSLNLTLFLEGLYTGNHQMRQANDNLGPHFGEGVADQLTVELHSATNYNNVLFSTSNVVLGMDGNATVAIPLILTGSFYITIKQRNHIETTTAFPVSFTDGVINYTFDLPTKAYGNNLNQMNDNTFAIYGGDINQDGIVDGTDMAAVDNSSTSLTKGYVSDDANGDGIVDGSDMALVDNNSTSIVKSKLPYSLFVITSPITNITSSSAQSGGNIIFEGCSPIIKRGVCWNTTTNPTINSQHTTDGNGPGNYTSIINSLNGATTYFVRAYAINSSDTAYGNVFTFSTPSMGTPCPGISSLYYSGQVYNTVKIGNQCWLKENLNVGNRIDNDSSSTNNNLIEKFCWNDLDSNCTVFGGIYQWDEMMNYSTYQSDQGICPDGWHIPSLSDFYYLENLLGFVAGSKMKEAGNSHWLYPNTDATNETGFTALPINPNAEGKGDYGSWFSSTLCGIYWPPPHIVSTLALSSYLEEAQVNMGCGKSLVYPYIKMSVRCLRDDSLVFPGITTSPIRNITSHSAKTGGEVIPRGGTKATERGVCWSFSHNPTTSDSHISSGVGSGFFECTITNLQADTIYFVRAYAINGAGIVYGSERYFSTATFGFPCPGIDSIIYEGKSYKTVQIGDQCWLRENLNIGVSIRYDLNQTNNGILEKYCEDNLDYNCEISGGLYQWDEAMQYSTVSGSQGICPAGWHIPSQDDWTVLSNYLGGQPLAGGSMKEVGSATWVLPNIGATNASGFSALPNTMGSYTSFWASTSTFSDRSWMWELSSYSDDFIAYDYGYRSEYMSVRCMKDDNN